MKNESKPYSYPAPSPIPGAYTGDSEYANDGTGQATHGTHGTGDDSGAMSHLNSTNYPNMKFYKNQGLNVNDFSTINQERITIQPYLTPFDLTYSDLGLTFRFKLRLSLVRGLGNNISLIKMIFNHLVVYNWL